MLKVYLFDAPKSLSQSCTVASGSVSFKPYTDKEKQSVNDRGYCSQQVSVKVIGEAAQEFAETGSKGLFVVTQISEMKVNTFERKSGELGTEIVITTFECPQPAGK